MTRDIVAIFSCSIYTNDDLANDNIPAGKSVGDFKEYHVVSGSTFTEEYNETLHSAAILLDHVSLHDRLRLRPKLRYEFVKVFDRNPLDPNNPFEEYYIVDNYVEKETNIHDHIFSYTIQLVSETKILEKIQCPNLAITHKINPDGSTTKKPIYQYIEQYMGLFIPKFKFTSDGETWDYEPLIKMPTGEALTRFRDRFSQLCADMPLTAPTMRQLLTMLMQQVGCIPTVNNRVLGFLDFQIDDMNNIQFGGGEGYDVNNTVNYIQKSCSIDSAANNLIKMSSNVLDSSNKVVVETIGFRDSGNAFLKQTQNLKLETSFPIYKIEEVIMKGLCYTDSVIFQQSDHQGTGTFWDIEDKNDNLGMVGYDCVSNLIKTDSSGNKYASINLREKNITGQTLRFSGNASFTGRAFFYNTKDSLINEKLSDLYVDVEDERLTLNNLLTPSPTLEIEIYPPEGLDFDGFVFVGEVTMSGYAGSGSDEKYNTHKDLFVLNLYTFMSHVNFLVSIDITPLVVESSVRATLDANFVNMGGARTISDLSKYLYGTIQYSIGSKEISGFSSTYSVGSKTMFGWLNQNYTYIENIWNFILKKEPLDVINSIYRFYFGNAYERAYDYLTSLGDFTDQEVRDILESTFSIDMNSLTTGNKFYISNWESGTDQNIQGKLDNMYKDLKNNGIIEESEYAGNNDDGIIPVSQVAQAVSTIFSSKINFGLLFFDIKYQPLNSFNLSYTTNEDVPFAIEQYDGSADAISDFDRLSISTQEKVDRIGNETLSINQRTENPSDIQPVPCYYQDDFDRDGMIDEDDLEPIKYVVFRKQYSINNYHFDVNYTGSKDAILKNYFTSIRTKYRAYQYVDYNSSVLRKERDTIYVCISENGYFNGDDKIFFGNFGDETSRNEQKKLFISGCAVNQDFGDVKPIMSSAERSTCINNNAKQIVRNDLSIITTKNILAFVYEDRDNVGAGPYISISQMARGGWYGGILQTHQIWDEATFNLSHSVFFISGSSYTELFSGLTNDNWTTYASAANIILQSPIMTPIIDDNDTGIVHLIDGNDILFLVVDYNNTTETESTDPTIYKRERTFYKDYAELINHTVQFIYYTDSKNIEWTEEFIKRSGFLFDKSSDIDNNLEFYFIPIEINGKLKEEEYSSNYSARIPASDICKINITYEDRAPYIFVDWDRESLIYYRKIKLVSFNPNTNKYKDIISFKRDNSSITEQEFFVSLNDTRSDKVWAEKDGLIYTLGTIGYNNNDRSLVTETIDKVLTIETHQASITVSRLSSNVPDATIGELSSGDIVYAGDVIGFSNPTIAAYYQNYVLRVNGAEISVNQRYIVAPGDSEVKVMIAAGGLIRSLSNPPQFSTKYTHDYSTNEVTVTVSCNEPELNDNDTVTFRYFLNGTSTYGGAITNHSSATISLGTYSSATTINITDAYFRFEFPSSYGAGRFVESDYVDKTYNISTRNLVNPSITINGYEEPRVNVSFTNNNSFSVVCHYSSSSGLDGGSQTIPAHSSITKQMRHRPGQISMTISAYFVAESSSSIQISETVSATWNILNV